MSKLHFTIATVLTCAFIAALANADQLMGAGGTYMSGRIAASTSTACVQETTDAGARCVLFHAGQGGANAMKMAVITAWGAGRCAWTGLSSNDLTAMNWSAGNYGIGGGSVHSFPVAGAEWHTRPDFFTSFRQPGGVTGICSTAVYNGRDTIYPPCDQTSDCTTYSAGTCNTAATIAANTWTDAQKQNVGMFLVCESDSGTVNFDYTKEKVPR